MNNDQLIATILKALHAANCAACECTDYEGLDYRYGDQKHLFGHLSAALKLIAPDTHAAYIDSGDPIPYSS